MVTVPRRLHRQLGAFAGGPDFKISRAPIAMEVLRGDGEAREDQLCGKPLEKASQLVSEEETNSSSQQMFHH